MTTIKSNRILHIHWGFPPTIGGVETHLTILLPELVKNGAKVMILTSSFDGVDNEYIFNGVEVRRSPLFDLNWLVKRGLAGLEPDLRRLYEKIFEEFSPTIVHTHNMHYFSELHIRLLEEMCQKRGIPLLLTAHNVWDNTLFLKLTREVAWDHVIAVSHYIRMELLGVGLEDTKTTTVHHGLDLDRYPYELTPSRMLKKYPKLKGRPVVFHPARMGMAKGCDVTIKAMRFVLDRFPDAMLVLAGSKNIIDWEVRQEKDIAYFIDLIRALGIEKNTLIDVFALEDMPEMYRISDVVVYPSSVAEPFGLAMLEAFASRRPIIVTRMGGMPEIVQDEISGYVINHRDFEALGSRILLLFENERLKRRLGETGRQIVEQHYTKEIMTRAHMMIYERVLAGRPVNRDIAKMAADEIGAEKAAEKKRKRKRKSASRATAAR